MIKRSDQPPAVEQSQLTLQVGCLSHLGKLIKHQIQLIRIKCGTKRLQVQFLALCGILCFARLACRVDQSLHTLATKLRTWIIEHSRNEPIRRTRINLE